MNIYYIHPPTHTLTDRDRDERGREERRKNIISLGGKF